MKTKQAQDVVSENKTNKLIMLRPTHIRDNKMKKLFVLSFVMLLLVSCGPTYRVRTNFYLLNRGISKQEFVAWMGLNEGKNYIGKQPIRSKSFRNGNDIWEVWVFEVYRFYKDAYGRNMADTRDFHYEHVAFKNGKVEEWGMGDMPNIIFSDQFLEVR
jgi:hypothetical protein